MGRFADGMKASWHRGIRRTLTPALSQPPELGERGFEEGIKGSVVSCQLSVVGCRLSVVSDLCDFSDLSQFHTPSSPCLRVSVVNLMKMASRHRGPDGIGIFGIVGGRRMYWAVKKRTDRPSEGRGRRFGGIALHCDSRGH